MRNYQFNFLDQDGRIFRAEMVPCKDDLDALAYGARASAVQTVELWDGSRLVARVDPNNAKEPA